MREHAGFAAAGKAELESLREWLLQRALEHERPSLLFSQACVELHRRRVERPAIDRVMRLVAWARERAHERTFEQLAPQLTLERRAALDGLLATSEGARTRLVWLRSRPTTVSGRALQAELDKRRYLLEELGVDRFDLSGLPPNRRAWLAQTGRQSSNQALARMAPERRYPVLACFCAEALERTTDDAVDVFDRALGTADRSRRVGSRTEYSKTARGGTSSASATAAIASLGAALRSSGTNPNQRSAQSCSAIPSRLAGPVLLAHEPQILAVETEVAHEIPAVDRLREPLQPLHLGAGEKPRRHRPASVVDLKVLDRQQPIDVRRQAVAARGL